MKYDFGQIALVLLAAGHSRRFGKPKLGEKLHGKTLVHHAASTLSTAGFAFNIAVVGDNDWGLDAFGFELVPSHAANQSQSLAAGITAALTREPSAIMIALGDMPFVPLSHYRLLVDAFDGRCIASSDGTTSMPPAIFGQGHFGTLGELRGDTGARALLQNAPVIVAGAFKLVDVDTPEQLAAANQSCGAK
jgi:molybdenum cofactor cytidylyltransferase